jgi:flagellar biosynthesis chaperone FliJ
MDVDSHHITNIIDNALYKKLKMNLRHKHEKLALHRKHSKTGSNHRSRKMDAQIQKLENELDQHIQNYMSLGCEID